MNSDQNKITIQFHGQISINREKLIMLLSDNSHPEIAAKNPVPTKEINWPENAQINRLAYTMRETVEILGVSYITVHRLVKRGLLKKSSALRNIIIAKNEIERFLKETL